MDKMSEESSDDEVYEDAVEIQERLDPELNINTGIEDARIALGLFLNNQFNDARNVLKPWAGKSLYHTVGNAVFLFLEAVLTFDKKKIEEASTEIKNTLNLCNYYRRKTTLGESLGKMIKKSNYDNLSSEEMHAELCYAESLLLKSLLSILEDETFVSFIKAGLKIRSCYNSYKTCNNILKNRNWQINETHKIHFASGVHVGIGGFNLMISMLPPKIIKLLEFIGFSGSMETGLNELKKGYSLRSGIRHILCVFGLLTYYLVLNFILSIDDGDLKLCEEIINDQLQLYPNGAWFFYFKARLELLKGNFDVSNKYYIHSWQSQSEWQEFHHICFWDLMWVHSSQLNWREASNYASKLLHASKWSVSVYGYQQLSFLLMLDTLTAEDKKQIEYLQNLIPKSKQRLAGKSIPIEKFSVRRCERYIQEKSLVLPAVEMIYLWNYFKILAKKWDLIHGIFKMIITALNNYQTPKNESEFWYDNKALLLLLKGACLRQMESPLQAEECLKEVLQLEKKLKQDHFLIPYTLTELAIIYYQRGIYQKSIKLLEDTKKNYTGYLLESRLHFRIHKLLIEMNKNT